MLHSIYPSGEVTVSSLNEPPHRPVLYHEVIEALQPINGGRYVDATLGAGGHAAGILEACAPDGTLIGFEIDPFALEIARTRLAAFGKRVTFLQASYRYLQEQLKQAGIPQVQGILLDLGLSSMQLNDPERGFSFLADGVLDMRFDPSAPRAAADLVNGLSVEDLAALLRDLGEEKKSRIIADAIVRARPIRSTRQLAEVIEKTIGQRGRIHPATKTFQALRIAVNSELENLQVVLPQIVAALTPGSRAAMISFHSLEDRIVKQFFQRESRDCICPPRQPVCTCQHKAVLRLVNKHPIMASDLEIQRNPRARSARLRVAERL